MFSDNNSSSVEFKQKVHTHQFRVTKIVKGVSIRDILKIEPGVIVEISDLGCAEDVERSVKVEQIQKNNEDLLE